MRKKLTIPYSKQRAVLSDVLPYEVPLIFSNRYFYKLLNKREKAIKNEEFKLNKFKAFKEVEYILFNIPPITKPFKFKIKHNKSDFRELNLIHPLNQSEVVRFYEKYKSLIIYYSSVSPFSIRKATSVAKFTFYNDILHKKKEDDSYEHSQIEEQDNEYENLKSYFTYQKYSNIHKFYESYQFHRSEKKFNNLLKVDISKCFDSIYTHTISWALINKSIIKDNIEHSLKSFPGEFDKMMQTLNANETNGIVIGPEFSRIFAELILQQIDKNILENLRTDTGDCKVLIHKRDYEIFRYVDDYFIFFNTEEEKDIILKEFKLCFKEYKLYINDGKSTLYDKPIITEISLAKQKISDLFNEHLKLREADLEGKTALYFSSNNVITRFKSIVKETNVEYKDIMNYSLAVLDNKTSKLIKIWQSLEDKNDRVQKHFEKGFLEILDVSFFLYSVAPRVNSTIKLCLIISKIILFLKKNKSNDYKEPFLISYKQNIFKKISDEIYLVLQKAKSESITQIESLYLLIALSQLGREYRLSPKNLCTYFNIQYIDNKVKINKELNYFCIVVLLFYIKDISMYLDIKKELKVYILEKFESKKVFEWRSETELTLLLLDIMSCPYLEEDSSWQRKKIIDAKQRGSRNIKRYIEEEKNARYRYKKTLLSLLNIQNNHIPLIESEKYWFVKWNDFDFRMELQAKRSQEVY